MTFKTTKIRVQYKKLVSLSSWFHPRYLQIQGTECRSRHIEMHPLTLPSTSSCLQRNPSWHSVQHSGLWKANEFSTFRGPALRVTRPFHSSCGCNNKNANTQEVNRDQTYKRVLIRLRFRLGLIKVWWTTRAEFKWHKFIDIAYDGFHFLRRALASENMDDVAACVTEHGLEACNDLLPKLARESITMARETDVVMELRSIDFVKAEDSASKDGLSVVVWFHNVVGKNFKWTFEVTYFASLNEEGKRVSAWFVDDIYFEKP